LITNWHIDELYICMFKVFSIFKSGVVSGLLLVSAGLTSNGWMKIVNW